MMESQNLILARAWTRILINTSQHCHTAKGNQSLWSHTAKGNQSLWSILDGLGKTLTKQVNE